MTYIHKYQHNTKGLERKLKAYLVLLLTIFSGTNEMVLIQCQRLKREKQTSKKHNIGLNFILFV